jgi:predicted glycosyl hydrolase (DUF1957 family)
LKYWAPLLHIYQPPTQEVEVLKRINEECYKPLFTMLKRNNYARISLNINGILIDLLEEYGLHETIEMLKDLVYNGIVEIVGTAKFHPLLPLIPEKEMIHQIDLNEELNEKVFGKKWVKRGFFPPEMAISEDVLKVIANKGYHWVILSGIACPEEWPTKKIYKTKNGLRVFFRDDVISNEISFQTINADQFIKKVKTLYESNGSEEDYYFITAMDGETFGHHIRNYETTFLEKALLLADKDPEIKMFISDLQKIFPTGGEIIPKPSSWSTTFKDMEQNIPYPLWKHPNNPVHKQQYRMFRALDALISLCDEHKTSTNESFVLKYRTARYFYDEGIYSCPLWWASMRPSWDPTLIYKGANLLLLSALNAQLALTYLRVSEGDEIFDRFIDYHHKLLSEITKQTANLLNVRTY